MSRHQFLSALLVCALLAQTALAQYEYDQDTDTEEKKRGNMQPNYYFSRLSQMPLRKYVCFMTVSYFRHLRVGDPWWKRSYIFDYK